MVVEIELKARLDDVDLVKKRLSVMGSFIRSYTKADSYWLVPHSGKSALRIRREHGFDDSGSAYERMLVTSKSKTISGGMEINEELEITISDASLFKKMLEQVGFLQAMHKEKNGWLWAIPSETACLPSIHAELSRLEALGWFLELEILAQDNSSQTVEDSRKRLLALLEELGVPIEHIEERTYSTMLAAIQHGG